VLAFKSEVAVVCVFMALSACLPRVEAQYSRKSISGTLSPATVIATGSSTGLAAPAGVGSSKTAATPKGITSRNFVLRSSSTALAPIALAQACTTDTTTWTGYPLGASETGSFSVSFDVTPQTNATDANVALSQNTPAAYADLAAIVRFNNSGNIDVRNGSAYAANYTQPYTAGATYHMQMVANVATHKYTVYVTPPGAAQAQLATNYAFRTEQASVPSLNYWTTYEDATAATGPLQVCNFNVAASTTVSISPGTASLTVGGTQQFTATVAGTTDTAVTWSTTGGTITTGGLYTAPNTAGTYSVTATSVADPTKSAAATVTVTATAPPVAGQLSVTPVSFTFGVVNVGTSSPVQTGTLTATNGDVTITTDTLTGAGFILSGLSFPFTITSGNSANFYLNFAPVSSGNTSGTLSFTSNASNTFHPIVLSGTGAGLSLTPNALSFGSVPDGTSSTSQTGTLSAIGSNMMVTAANVQGPFSVSGLPAVPFTIAAGQSQAYTVTFNPVAGSPGAKAGSVSFSNSANTQTESLSGTGVANVLFTWTASDTPNVTYSVYRCTVSAAACVQSSPGNFTRIAAGIGALTYTDITVSSGQNYYYAVTAVDGSGSESPFSAIVTAPVP